MHASIDISTLNIAAVKQLKTYTLPPSYHLGGYGSACSLDAPGFPSYMVQGVYTKFGNTPSKAPGHVLSIDGSLYIMEPPRIHAYGSWEAYWAAYRKLLHSVWRPLPLDHERVQLWMAHVYQHFARCYRDVERPEHGRPGTLIFPIPDFQIKHPKVLTIPATATDKEITQIRESQRLENELTESLNATERIRAEYVATPENHLAVLSIREFYPEHQPNLEWIANPPRLSQADWWETAATKPTPETCAPRNSLGGRENFDWSHPTDPGRHCHFCGHDNPKEEK